jgi:hypothetical protein
MLSKLLILKVGEAGEPTDYAIFAEQVAALLRCSVWSPRFSLRKELCRIHPSPPEDVVTPASQSGLPVARRVVFARTSSIHRVSDTFHSWKLRRDKKSRGSNNPGSSTVNSTS